MRFVWVTADLAAPPRAGGEIRTSRLIRGLAAHADVDVVVLSLQADCAAIQAETGATDVLHVPPRPGPVRKRARAALHAIPTDVAAILRPAAFDLIKQRARDGAVVVCDHLQTAPYLGAASVSVLNLHNADTALRRGMARPATRLRRMERRWDLAAAERLERWALTTATLAVCVSDEDRDTLGTSAVVVPNGADLPTSASTRPQDGSILFIGSLNYPPNEDAVRWWVEAVSTHLPPDLPPLTVVGRSAQSVLADLVCDPRLRVYGDAADVRPYLLGASVVVVPVRQGSGSRLKLVEGMAWSRPVVSTTKGAEGFPVQDGLDLLLADLPQDFALAVTRAYRDRDLATSLGSAGRRFAERYDWNRLGEVFAEAVISATSTR